VRLIGRSFFTGCCLLAHLIPGRARASGLLLCNAADSEPIMMFTGVMVLIAPLEPSSGPLETGCSRLRILRCRL
jgi:hypothetical protein